MMGFRHRLAVEISIHHGRREIDEMLGGIARAVERVLEGPEAVVEGAERILVGAVRMSDRGKLHNNLRLQLRQRARQGVVVARIQHVQRDVVFPHQIDALVDQVKVKSLERIVHDVGKCAEIVDLQPVEHMNIGAERFQRQGEVVPDKTGAADQSDALS